LFKKILIANRGEIACRIIKTARKMGIATVAVFSDADARGLHVEMADEKVNIGPAPAADSYLRIDHIIDACKKTGAEAVHPGYGFLSERAAFPKALAENGIVFIGPNPRAIEAMGDKIESKKAAAAAGVSTVPGYMGVIETVEHAKKIAADVGFPVMIKASAGGGGKGMRIAHSANEVEEGFERARSEARSSFGDDRVFIEKFIKDPRHIEIQVLGDKHGNIIYLGERECSIQRRNQKVIEEAPSPLLDEKTRRAMGEQAVALARAVGYDSAGTVEFVAGQDRSFFFLEMNTRLQVEHPVTELVTGIDLVEQMIRVAAGEKLSLAQKDVKLNGWAIESRIYAEDPYRGFLPSTGRLTTYRPPNESATVRNDTGTFEGGEISVWYDPMIAKLCTHGATRIEAIDAMASALDDFVVDGIQHNVPFLSAIMQNEVWRSGKLSTGFITQQFPEGFQGVAPSSKQTQMLATIAAMLDHKENLRRRAIGGQVNSRAVHFSTQREVRIADRWIKFEVTPEFERRAAGISWTRGDPVAIADTGQGPVTVQVKCLLNGYRLKLRGISIDAFVYSDREAELARLMPKKKLADTSNRLTCPMPGMVKLIAVKEGQDVKAGEPLAIVEAMKMENILRAERDLVVKRILAKTGDSLPVDSVIMEFAQTA
jgi:propionyl-CoA carboxylase alpha chain